MKYTHLLPFLDSKEIKELATQITNGEVKGVKISTLYPFLDRETMNEIAEKLIETKNIKALKYSLPFISNETISKIHDEIKKGELKGLKETYLLPFMGQVKIKEMFTSLIKNAAFDSDDLEDDIDDIDEDLDYDLEDLDEEKEELLKEKEALKKELAQMKKNLKK